jgi:hypothetical protein
VSPSASASWQSLAEAADAAPAQASRATRSGPGIGVVRPSPMCPPIRTARGAAIQVDIPGDLQCKRAAEGRSRPMFVPRAPCAKWVAPWTFQTRVVGAAGIVSSSGNVTVQLLWVMIFGR